MAHRVLGTFGRAIQRRPIEVKQKFNYLLVTDFEATCDDIGPLQPQEIIEFPCVAVSTNDWQVKDVFHQYVKPRVHPELTVFCTDLTGIVQEMVDQQPYFPEVFRMFQEWLEKGEYFKAGNKSAFITVGEWDLKVMLPNQCSMDNIPLPDYCKLWINLNTTYCEATNYYPRSFKDMLVRMQIPLQGKLHSGINDAMHMVKVIQALQKHYNVVYKINGKCSKEPLEFKSKLSYAELPASDKIKSPV